MPEFRAYPLPDLGKNLLRLIGKRFSNFPGNRRSDRQDNRVWHRSP